MHTVTIEGITGLECIACILDLLSQDHEHSRHFDDCLTVSCPFELGSVIQKYVSFQFSYVRVGHILGYIGHILYSSRIRKCQE